MNLVINAAEAVGDKPGTVMMAISPCDLDSEYLKTLNPMFDVQPGNFVCLEVQDSGCGMDPATVGKIFDPFLTTKVTGRGLELSAVLGIVRGHRGSLKVDSESGRGTLFKVLFPVTPGEAVRSAEERSRNIRNAGTILVIEDARSCRENRQSAASVKWRRSSGFRIEVLQHFCRSHTLRSA